MQKRNIIIISDTHLTHKFDERKFIYLKNLFENSNQIIINGDFWSYYSCTFDQFIESKWNQLFAILKSKNTIYIYGNHDRERWCDQRVALFCNRACEKYDLQAGKKLLKVIHGHQIFSDSIQNETYIKLDRFLQFDIFVYKIHQMIINIFGIERYNQIGWFINKGLKEGCSELKENEILVVGHSHTPEVSENFINTGFINYHLSHFLEIKNDGTIELINESY